MGEVKLFLVNSAYTVVVDFVVVFFMILVYRCMAILAFCYDVSHVLFCLLILSGDVELHPGPRLTGRPQCRVILPIYIPWPFLPVWGVADNTKETNKNNGGFTPFFQQ